MPAPAVTGSAGQTFDFSAFDGPVDRAAVRAFLASDDPGMIELEERAAGRLRLYAIIGVPAFLTGLALYLFIPPLDDDGRLASTLTFGGLLSIALWVFELPRSGATRAYRIARFAEANGFAFSHLKGSVGGYEGVLVANGWDHHRWMVVNATLAGRRVEFGDVSYTEGMGRNYTRRRGYIAMRLPARLPRMLFTKGSNPLFTATIPQYPHPDHRVDVGQGRALRVYTPDSAVFVARALFTPEVLGLFSRLARRYTIEVVGDVLFLTRFRGVSTGSGRRWRRQLADVQALARAMAPSGVWQVMRGQPKHFLQCLPEMRLHFLYARPVLTALVIVGGIVGLAVLITLPMILMEVL